MITSFNLLILLKLKAFKFKDNIKGLKKERINTPSLITLIKYISKDNSIISNIISKSVNKKEVSSKGLSINKGKGRSKV